MLYALLGLAGILSFASVMSSYYPLKWAAGFAWLATFFYWLNADLVVDGTPTDVAVMLLFVMLSVLFLLWGMAGRKGRDNSTVEERYSSTGKLVDKVIKSVSNKHTHIEPHRETTLEYRDKVRNALHNNNKRRRR